MSKFSLMSPRKTMTWEAPIALVDMAIPRPFGSMSRRCSPSRKISPSGRSVRVINRNMRRSARSGSPACGVVIASMWSPGQFHPWPVSANASTGHSRSARCNSEPASGSDTTSGAVAWRADGVALLSTTGASIAMATTTTSTTHSSVVRCGWLRYQRSWVGLRSGRETGAGMLASLVN